MATTIWVDLDNSPHVPFFIPIIKELGCRGYSLYLTGRECFQVRELIELSGLQCKMVGRHWGGNRLLKVLGTCARALELATCVRGNKPDLALSHGSRAQVLACALLRIPSVMIDDYEFSQRGINPDWVMVPDVIPESTLKINKRRVLRYPGIKEDAYVPQFQPDPRVQDVLGLANGEIVVTVRPPASEAHYHNPESDVLYQAVMTFLMSRPYVKVVLVPRSTKQELSARGQWKSNLEAGELIIPHHAVDGLSLIWFSDLVISGGGTMNREAAAMGVPVYSIFRGPIGAVDRYLVGEGRLILIEKVDDLPRKLVLKHRSRSDTAVHRDGATLTKIMENLVSVIESRPTNSRPSACS